MLQSLATFEVKKLADNIQGDASTRESVRAALQAVVGCAGAAAGGSGDCGSAAAGAAASVVLNNLLSTGTSTATDKDGKPLTLEEQQARTNLVASLVAAIASAASADASAATTAAIIETENNSVVPPAAKDPQNQSAPPPIICKSCVDEAFSLVGRRLVIAGVVTQADSPAPGPADIVGGLAAAISALALVYDVGKAFFQSEEVPVGRNANNTNGAGSGDGSTPKKPGLTPEQVRRELKANGQVVDTAGGAPDPDDEKRFERLNTVDRTGNNQLRPGEARAGVNFEKQYGVRLERAPDNKGDFIVTRGNSQFPQGARIELKFTADNAVREEFMNKNIMRNFGNPENSFQKSLNDAFTNLRAGKIDYIAINEKQLTPGSLARITQYINQQAPDVIAKVRFIK